MTVDSGVLGLGVVVPDPISTSRQMSRLSVQPVTKAEFAIVVRLGRTAPA